MATEGKSFRPSTRKNWETVWRCHIDADLGGWHMSVSARMRAGVQIAASESQGGSVTAGGLQQAEKRPLNRFSQCLDRS
jgi:hypothetical protein